LDVEQRLQTVEITSIFKTAAIVIFLELLFGGTRTHTTSTLSKMPVEYVPDLQ
jgi:hypothetical protein